MVHWGKVWLVREIGGLLAAPGLLSCSPGFEFSISQSTLGCQFLDGLPTTVNGTLAKAVLGDKERKIRKRS